MLRLRQRISDLPVSRLRSYGAVAGKKAMMHPSTALGANRRIAMSAE
jgi:hypothetical protein